MKEKVGVVPCFPQEKPNGKGKLTKVLIAALLFVACPGDDITAIVASNLPPVVQTQVAPAETILGLLWVDQRDKERRHKENKQGQVEEGEIPRRIC